MSEVEMALEADEGGQVPRHFSFARCFRIIGIFDDLSDRFYRMAGAQFSIKFDSPNLLFLCLLRHGPSCKLVRLPRLCRFLWGNCRTIRAHAKFI